jgi:hypothetical protein
MMSQQDGGSAQAATKQGINIDDIINAGLLGKAVIKQLASNGPAQPSLACT